MQTNKNDQRVNAFISYKLHIGVQIVAVISLPRSCKRDKDVAATTTFPTDCQ